MNVPICTPKELPADMKVAAAANAMRINPTNHPRVDRMIRVVELHAGQKPPNFVLAPEHLALMTQKYWGTGGVKLSVSFMESLQSDLRDKLLSHMNAWGQYCNVSFAWTSGVGDVRISRGSGGYWSYIGTDIQSIPHNQQTMNLEGFTMAMPESEFVRVVRHETGHCLSGGTLIDCPRNLKTHPLGIPINELVGTQPWVYAWKDGRIVVRKASRVWLSRRNAPTVRVILRTGRGYHKGQYRPPLELIGTADHPVLLSDGVTWKNLGDLKSGDRLCSLYRSKNGQRSRITWTGLNDRVREHVLVAESVYGPRPEGHDCHHKDENMLNQTVENLEWKNEFDHHSDHGKGKKMPAESVARRADAYRGFHHSEESKAAMSAAHTGKTLSEETKAKMSASTKGRKQSQELIENRTESMRTFYANGGRSGMFGKTASQETRRKRSESMKRTLASKRAANHVVVSVEPWLSQDVYDMTVPDAESFIANGVVVHNCLGFPHEHMRKEIVQLIDPAKAIKYFGQTQGWSPAMVQQQVLTPLSDASIMGTPHADQTSIMCYQLPGSITTNGQPIIGGTDIDALDQQFAAKVYPLPTPPKPNPPPVNPPTGAVQVVIPQAGTYVLQAASNGQTGASFMAHDFTFDVSDVQTVLSTGASIGARLNSAIWLAGFAAQQAVPPANTGAAKGSAENGRRELERLTTTADANQARGLLSSIDWQSVGLFLAKLILELQTAAV